MKRAHGIVLFAALGAAAVSLVIGQQTQPARKRQAAEKKRAPDLKDVRYGPHPRNVLDLWKAKSDRPAPVVVYIHGGGFRAGDKNLLPSSLLELCLDKGISVASINYRLSQDAPFPAPMLDGARAVQFIRHKAKEWNIDPPRVAASGGSAGAGMSLWIGFHDDLAEPNSDDPVRRETTRLACMGVFGAQTSYDPRFIEKEIAGRTFDHPALLPFYGLKPDEVETPRAFRLYEQASPINHVTKDDPPVFMFYSVPRGKPGPDAGSGDIIHHPLFGELLKRKLDPLGIECIVRNRADYKGNPLEESHGEMAAFFARQFRMTKN